jgi:DNA-directed RNA polymerase specialized sigma24 family protein
VRPSKQDRDTSFAAFMDQAGPTLLRTAWFLTGNTDRAQELTQAALVKTYLAWPRIDHAGAHAYARKCLVNHKIDVWRATRHEVISDFTAPGPELGTASTGLPRLMTATNSYAGCPGCLGNSAPSSSFATTPTSPRRRLLRRSASPSAR